MRNGMMDMGESVWERVDGDIETRSRSRPFEPALPFILIMADHQIQYPDSSSPPSRIP